MKKEFLFLVFAFLIFGCTHQTNVSSNIESSLFYLNLTSQVYNPVKGQTFEIDLVLGNNGDYPMKNVKVSLYGLSDFILQNEYSEADQINPNEKNNFFWIYQTPDFEGNFPYIFARACFDYQTVGGYDMIFTPTSLTPQKNSTYFSSNSPITIDFSNNLGYFRVFKNKEINCGNKYNVYLFDIRMKIENNYNGFLENDQIKKIEISLPEGVGVYNWEEWEEVYVNNTKVNSVCDEIENEGPVKYIIKLDEYSKRKLTLIRGKEKEIILKLFYKNPNINKIEYKRLNAYLYYNYCIDSNKINLYVS